MASDKEFVKYIVDQIAYPGEISFKHMFGEFGVYADGKFFAVICDNKFFVKPTVSGKTFIGDANEVPPYPGAKPYFLIEDQLDDREWLGKLTDITVSELPEPKKKRPKSTKKK